MILTLRERQSYHSVDTALSLFLFPIEKEGTKPPLRSLDRNSRLQGLLEDLCQIGNLKLGHVVITLMGTRKHYILYSALVTSHLKFNGKQLQILCSL